MNDEANEPDLDLCDVSSADELHDRLASQFGCPDYLRTQWDAFDDCIWELGPT
jgi:hypothetical protein